MQFLSLYELLSDDHVYHYTCFNLEGWIFHFRVNVNLSTFGQVRVGLGRVGQPSFSGVSVSQVSAEQCPAFYIAF